MAEVIGIVSNINSRETTLGRFTPKCQRLWILLGCHGQHIYLALFYVRNSDLKVTKRSVLSLVSVLFIKDFEIIY